MIGMSLGDLSGDEQSSEEPLDPRATVLLRLGLAKACGDVECAHGDADDALCEFLRALGYGDVANAFENVPKWYA